jgi:hypothetical protein
MVSLINKDTKSDQRESQQSNESIDAGVKPGQ